MIIACVRLALIVVGLLSLYGASVGLELQARKAAEVHWHPRTIDVAPVPSVVPATENKTSSVLATVTERMVDHCWEAANSR